MDFNVPPPLRLTAREKRKLQALENKKRAHETQHEDLELQLEELEKQMIETQAEYGAIYNHNAPVMSLPNEIVALIFRFSVAGVEGKIDAGDLYPHYSTMEVVVSLVCGRWRNIALSLPVIWSTFRYDASAIPNPELSLTRLAAYLRRSKSHLLEFYFNFRTSRGERGSEEEYALLVMAILPHAERWHRVTILVDLKMDVHFPREPFQRLNAPHLVHFAFCPNSQDQDSYYEDVLASLQPMVLRGGAPNLTSALLDARGFGTFLPPLANITTLRVEGDTTLTSLEVQVCQEAFFEVLALPALKNLSVCGGIFQLDADDVSWPESISMANLRHFRFSDSTLLMHTLTLLNAPLLETLELKDIDGELIEHLTQIATATPFPSLRSLAIHECELSPDGVGRFMCSISAGITSLLLSQQYVNDSLLFSAIDQTFIPNFHGAT